MVESFLWSIGSALSGTKRHLFTSSQEKPHTRQPQTLPYSSFKVASKTYESHGKIHHGSRPTFAISFFFWSSYFSHLEDKTLNKSNKWKSLFGSKFEDRVHHGREGIDKGKGAEKGELADHIWHFSWFIFIQSRTPANVMVPPTLRMGFRALVKSVGNASQTCPDVCLLDDSTSFLIDNEDPSLQQYTCRPSSEIWIHMKFKRESCHDESDTQ